MRHQSGERESRAWDHAVPINRAELAIQRGGDACAERDACFAAIDALAAPEDGMSFACPPPR
jgi:hypothetical protein